MALGCSDALDHPRSGAGWGGGRQKALCLALSLHCKLCLVHSGKRLRISAPPQQRADLQRLSASLPLPRLPADQVRPRLQPGLPVCPQQLLL